jgi:hypothetical protein
MMLTDEEIAKMWDESTVENKFPVEHYDALLDYLARFNESCAAKATSAHQINTFEPFFSPVSGKMINNRKDLKNHNREHNVEQVGNTYINEAERMSD